MKFEELFSDVNDYSDLLRHQPAMVEAFVSMIRSEGRNWYSFSASNYALRQSTFSSITRGFLLCNLTTTQILDSICTVQLSTDLHNIKEKSAVTKTLLLTAQPKVDGTRLPWIQGILGAIPALPLWHWCGALNRSIGNRCRYNRLLHGDREIRTNNRADQQKTEKNNYYAKLELLQMNLRSRKYQPRPQVSPQNSKKVGETENNSEYLEYELFGEATSTKL